MPSLWKKPKGNRISRLVSDLQTPSKRGGSLVVETGFPTSLIDLFVKHRDKLKKSKTKKHKSKKLKTVTEEQEDDFGGGCQISSLKPLVSHSLCESDKPRFSVLEKVDNFEEIVVNNDLSVGKPVAQESSVAEMIHDCGKVEEERKETVKGFNLKNMMFLLLILVGGLFSVVLLCAEKWVFALITLGVCLLLLGISMNVGFFMSCENGVWNWFWKGGLVVLGALYTKWFVVGITIGASLLILLEECTENSIFGFFKPCQDAKGKMESILQQIRKGGRGILTGTVLNGSNKEVLDNGVNDQEQVCKGFVSSREIEPECGNGLVSRRGVEGNGEGELGSRDRSLHSESFMLVEEEEQVKPISELLALESNDSNFPESLELNMDPEREEGGNGRKERGVDGKKNKKFWKKFLPKKKNSKRKTNENEGKTSVAQSNSSMIQDNAIGLKEEDEEDDEQEITKEGSLTSRSRSRSSLYEENEGRSVNFRGEMLQLDNIRNPKPCGMVKQKYGNMKYVTAMVIPLTGLIGGRMLAVVVTVMCYLVFKMVRS